MAEDKKKEIAVIEITEEYMKDRLYEFRGKKVMLDSDLAEIYGYETKNFKRQVKNNITKFEGDDFMFELNDEEVENLSRCKNFTLNMGRGSNIKYKPYVFTEQGVYMLMTIQVDGYSLDAQKDKLRKYAEFQDMEIVGEYSDEGHSGKNIKGRQEFMPPCVLKVRLSCLPALSFLCLLLLRLWSIPMLRRLQWYGAISGSLFLICSFWWVQ